MIKVYMEIWYNLRFLSSLSISRENLVRREEAPLTARRLRVLTFDRDNACDAISDTSTWA